MILHWYECAAVGNTKLCTFSLRATGASALFNAGVPERLIRDVTRQKSNALHLYEHPTEQQKKQVSAQGEELGKKNVSAQTNPIQQKIRHGASMCNSLFSGLSNCNVTISPQNFTVNISPTATTQSPEYDVKHLLGGIELEDLNNTCNLFSLHSTATYILHST